MMLDLEAGPGWPSTGQNTLWVVYSKSDGCLYFGYEFKTARNQQMATGILSSRYALPTRCCEE